MSAVADERRIAVSEAEKILGRRLDRRRVYALIDGQVCSLAKWTSCCAGCCEGHEAGCDRLRHAFWAPEPSAQLPDFGSSPAL